MKYLEPSSLSPGLQAAIKFWPKAKEPYEGWLELAQLPPVPFQGGKLRAEHALAIAHYDDESRAELLKGSSPGAGSLRSGSVPADTRR